jgi:prephenate dehydrogenase
MAGSEKTGMEHACADLFEGRPCFLTPAPDTPAPLLERARAFWKALGMRLTETDPARHDRLVAHVSHLPHALASALAAFLGEQEEALPAVAGTGLRDTTRIAAGDPELWVQIFRQNRPAVTEALEACARRLDGLRQALENGDEEALRAILVAGRAFRESLDTVEPQP